MIRDFIHVDDGFSVFVIVRKVIVKQDDCPTYVPKNPTFVPKNPKKSHFLCWCPSCGAAFFENSARWGAEVCGHCGQKLDWTDVIQ